MNQLSVKVGAAAIDALEGRPAGERHLLGVIEPGPHGLKLATVTIAYRRANECAIHFRDTSTLTFESWAEARFFVSAWAWYRLVKRRKPRAGGNLSDLGRHP